MTLRPISVVVGLMAGGFVTMALKFGAFVVVWYAHLPTAGLLFWVISLGVIAAGESTGGYVAARLSRSRGLAAAVAVGAIDLVLSLTSYLLRPAGWWAWWMNAMYLALMMAAAVAGGWFALRRGIGAQVTRPTLRDEAEAREALARADEIVGSLTRQR